MKHILSLLLALTVLLGVGAGSAEQTEDPQLDNNRTFYQVFVGSFSDGNNDGIGDLMGVINRLDYLNDGDPASGKSLGVEGIWLSPIFASPSYHKYDVKDYYAIDWRFGTMDTLRELVDKCHERDVKVILDLVLNHTSSQHPWFAEFKQARQKGDTSNPYYDFYACVTEAEKKGGVAYQKIANVDCWYECNFSGDMPELNYDNPAVREEMLNVAKYYLDLGVDGFRFDAVKYVYFGDTARSVAFWQWYMDELLKIKPDIYCVGECWSGENEIVEYYSALNCFNFAMAQAEGTVASAAKGFSLSKFTNYVVSFQRKIKEKNPSAMLMGFLSNHDMDRIAGAFITENNMRMAANLYLLCPGSPMIYYGEEIGLRGSRGSESTDANRRLAMRWGDDDLVRDPNGSTYDKSKQITTTVADQDADENSLLNYYRKLIALRKKYPAIACGTYSAVKHSNKNFGGFRVEYNGEVLGILHNNGTEAVTTDLTKLGGGIFSQVLDAIGVGGITIEGTLLTVDPQTSVIVQ